MENIHAGRRPTVNKLRRAGFFRELRHGFPDGPSLRDSIPKSGAKAAAPLVEYLSNAPVLLFTRGVVRDLLEPDTVIGPPHIRTDGEWCWPSDLAYYVGKYNCRLPEEFASHMKARNWHPPLDEEVKFEEIEL
jgi:hypothetical protein